MGNTYQSELNGFQSLLNRQTCESNLVEGVETQKCDDILSKNGDIVVNYGWSE